MLGGLCFAVIHVTANALLVRQVLDGPRLWFAFFALQGPMLWAEGEVRRAARARGWRLPPVLAVPLTLSILLLTGHVLFFPPCTETGLADRVVGNIRETYVGILRAWQGPALKA